MRSSTIKIKIVAINRTTRIWQELVTDYLKRFPLDYQTTLTELTPANRPKNYDPQKVMQMETEKLQAAIPAGYLPIVLDEHGREFTTMELAQKLNNWHNDQQNICLLIGGADGIAKSYLQTAPFIWSLSRLTLPHQLARVLLIEQLYRAWSIINHHPYHRI